MAVFSGAVDALGHGIVYASTFKGLIHADAAGDIPYGLDHIIDFFKVNDLIRT